MTSFTEWFKQATGHEPFPFQCDFACTRNGQAVLVDVPTGLGKTAMAVLGWLWQRRFADEEVRRVTPRRLIYCLPMRVLVEQTRGNVKDWLENLRNAGLLDDDLSEDVLMGGEHKAKWDIYPEHDAIIIGTQDMLLSRALNRGYAASRARWPMHFGLLNTDCLWVFDEIQLMGSGLATTAQLDAFRRQMGANNGAQGNGCKSVWMSATLRADWLRTVDFKEHFDDQGRINSQTALSLSDADHKNEQVQACWNAKKPLGKAESEMGDASGLAKNIIDAHKPGTRTIVVVNTVKRARELFDALNKATTPASKAKGSKKTGISDDSSSDAAASVPNLVLLHSRFRPPDRKKRVDEALEEVEPNGPGTIIVSTQVIEAGVDVSAATLFTELAPWASLVQRFGRCNRRGELNDVAAVRWIGLPATEKGAEKARYPYELAGLRAAADELDTLNDVGLGSLDTHGQSLSDDRRAALFPHRHTHVIRRKDLLDLFDTTPDLAGNDIDIDRYVREIDATDVRVFWRDYGDPDPQKEGATPNAINGVGRSGGELRVELLPLRNELCPVPIGEFKEFAKNQPRLVWRWNFTEKMWERADTNSIAPGQVYLVHADAGGYAPERGWSGKAKDAPSLEYIPQQGVLDGYDGDDESRTDVWQTVAEHTQQVFNEMERLLETLPMPEAEALRLAARWHDWGKAHAVFQRALPDERPHAEQPWAKAAGAWKRYERQHFRHELASALAVLQRPHESHKSLSDDDLNLVAYLIAAHHGKVRLSIRSMPNEQRPLAHNYGTPQPQKRFARGVWDGDELPGVDLGDGVTAPAITLSLEPMELGLCESEPFAGQPSWVERVLGLRDRLGPFRLAYLEAVLRAADARASAAATQGAAEVNGA